MSHPGDSLQKLLRKLVVLSLSCSAVGVQFAYFCSAAELKTLKLLPDSVQKFAKIAIAETDNLQHVTLVDPHGYGAAAGIQTGDEVVQAQLNGDLLILHLKRNGKPYQTSINLNDPSQKPFELAVTSTDTANDTSHRIPRPVPGNVSSNSLIDPQAFNSLSPQMAPKGPFNLNANTNSVAMQTDRFGRPIVDVNAPGQFPVVDVNSPLRILGNYQLELIVDQSLSMGNKDCPGGLTRWDWCGMQAVDLSRAISSFVPEGLTITPFNEGFNVHKNVNPQDIVTLFRTGRRHWGTQLAEPLANRINSFFKNRNRNPKPLLIAIITDGIPFPPPEPEMVIQELVKATKRMSNPFEVTVVFFSIGGRDRFGHNYLQYLDQNLFKDGARFHLVHTFPFEQLQQIGLANALVQTMQTYGQAR
jgi:hypothetical protein